MPTTIEWTDATWNPLRGCSRVSEGCRNCYAEGVAARFSKPGLAYDGLARFVVLTDGKKQARWTGVVRTLPDKLEEPLHWRDPKRIFVNSMSDLFHEQVPFEFIAAVFGIMAACPQHTFQILTKRPERMLEFFAWLPKAAHECEFLGGRDRNQDSGTIWRFLYKMASDAMGEEHFAKLFNKREDDWYLHGPWSWPLPNVHLGVSAEDQENFDRRVPILLQCPAAIRWISYEPALGFVDVGYGVDARERDIDFRTPDSGAWYHVPHGARIDWVVIGGESGPRARPFNVVWAASVIAECRGTDTHVFVKQLGARPEGTDVLQAAGHHMGSWVFDFDGEQYRMTDSHGGNILEWPACLRMRQAPPCTDSRAWDAAMRRAGATAMEVSHVR